ncbi:hypothetical protein NHE_0388 [Neorickettsia helminthoeca str. Oregon]|uniref:Uncharacterized protein n=1 Tax=Neorickettsia helminthoeca str. Oregon TaxID=1286528 RepID=X5GW88_9RICK|nr:hypothetical protein NHE_0388 [Neorickettsia helminthoeca str. Oregon]
MFFENGSEILLGIFRNLRIKLSFRGSAGSNVKLLLAHT